MKRFISFMLAMLIVSIVTLSVSSPQSEASDILCPRFVEGVEIFVPGYDLNSYDDIMNYLENSNDSRPKTIKIGEDGRISSIVVHQGLRIEEHSSCRIWTAWDGCWKNVAGLDLGDVAFIGEGHLDGNWINMGGFYTNAVSKAVITYRYQGDPIVSRVITAPVPPASEVMPTDYQGRIIIGLSVDIRYARQNSTSETKGEENGI